MYSTELGDSAYNRSVAKMLRLGAKFWSLKGSAQAPNTWQQSLHSLGPPNYSAEMLPEFTQHVG